MPQIIRNNNCILLFWIFCILSAKSFSQAENGLPVYLGGDGTLKYTPDERGNQVPDFSYCGYDAGNSEIPDVPVKIIIPPESGDATRKIQSAIDCISEMPLDEHGFRGAILFEKGTFRIKDGLK